MWALRSHFLEKVTSLEGWRFTPGDTRLVDVVDGSRVEVGDDLGVRVTTSTPRTLYVLSVYGDEDPRAQLVSPMRPSLLVDGMPAPRADARWGLTVEPGTHELVCTQIVEANPREGLVVFATEERSALFEGWLDSLAEAMRSMPFGVDHGVAFAMLDDLRDPAGARGGSLSLDPEDAERLARERQRYAGLSASKAGGHAEWDLGAELVRFDVLCEVAPE